MTDLSEIKQALAAFSSEQNFTIEQLNFGLINNSYKITFGGKQPPILLQKINTQVFKDPLSIQENYIRIWNFLKNDPTKTAIPKPVFDNSNKTILKRENSHWRAFEFIEDSITINATKTPEQAYTTARVFAKLTCDLNSFPVNELKTVLPDFHNLSLRYQQFEKSIDENKAGRLNNIPSLTEELKNRIHYCILFEKIRNSALFKKRVMHHDAKISNILFNKNSGEVICPVDLDTVMPGYFFSDIGDMIRSMTCEFDENHREFDSIQIRKEFYTSILDGYLSVMSEILTEEENQIIHYSGLIMIFMQALRFITDYLNGDIYYQINYPEQNLHRAMNQLTLLQKLEEFLKIEYQLEPEK